MSHSTFCSLSQLLNRTFHSHSTWPHGGVEPGCGKIVPRIGALSHFGPPKVQPKVGELRHSAPVPEIVHPSLSMSVPLLCSHAYAGFENALTCIWEHPTVVSHWLGCSRNIRFSHKQEERSGRKSKTQSSFTFLRPQRGRPRVDTTRKKRSAGIREVSGEGTRTGTRMHVSSISPPMSRQPSSGHP